MWLLENDGDVFNGKRLWLRPGKKFIFGRTTPVGGGFVIENKTISRKHLVIELEPVKPDYSMEPGTRSKVILEDLNTKIGTLVNGTQIRGQRHILFGDKHEIKLGQYDKLFYITWHPVVLSLSLTSKELKADPLPSLRERLEQLDIKILVDYSQEYTTHVVAKKRNTSKGLQALINGKYIVDFTFINAIVAVTIAENDEVTPLESDFKSSWPNELCYLPPRGAEPTQRHADAYGPDPTRQEIFDGYTFIFYDQSQFDNLLAPITNGRGKALLRHVDPSTTKVEDFLRYVKDVAGEKGLGEFEDGSEGKGVVVVRYQPAKGPTLDWYADFGRRLALQLDHRLIEQNEFLDAILNNKASALRRPLEVEPSDTVAPPSTEARGGTLRAPRSVIQTSGITVQNESSTEVAESSNLTSTAAARRVGRSRRTVTSRFKGFDDDFDMAAIPEANLADHKQAELPQTQTPGLFVSQPDSMDIEQENLGRVEITTRSSRKRPLTLPVENDDEGDVLDQLAPAATHLKRRRLANDLERRRRGEPTPSPPLPTVVPKAGVLKARPKKGRPEIDVIEVSRQQREKEDAIARAEREALLEAMHDMEIDQIRNLAVIEEIEVKRTVPPPRAAVHGDDGDRWVETWNGRKNFKKFRRRGEGAPRSINKVIVPLEEVRKKDFGIGDEYWLEEDKDGQKKKRGKKRAGEIQSMQSIGETQTQTVAQAQAQALALTLTLNQTQNETRSQTARSRRQRVESSPTEEPWVVESSTQATRTRSQRVSEKSQKSPDCPSQNKRRAEPMSKPAPTKKVKQTARDESDDSEDGLGFKFRKSK